MIWGCSYLWQSKGSAEGVQYAWEFERQKPVESTSAEISLAFQAIKTAAQLGWPPFWFVALLRLIRQQQSPRLRLGRQ
jgi:hypothetical protein